MVLTILLAGCSAEGPHRPWGDAAGGGGGAPAGKATGGAPGFAEVQAVFVKNCNACHPSKQPSDWMNYQTSKAGAQLLMRRVVIEKTMPQIGSAQQGSMTADERQLIARWVKAGAPKDAIAGAAPSNDQAAGDPSAGPAADAADPRYAAIQTCVGCHGTPPAGPGDATIPRLHGQNYEYLMQRLTLFKQSDPWDQSSPMNKVAFAMTGDQLHAAAATYAAGSTLRTDEPGAEPARVAEYARGRAVALEKCVMCHQNADQGGRTNDGLIPALVGQSEDYLRGQLYAFRSGARRSKEMYEFANSLSLDDVEAVSYYFSRAPIRP